MKFMKLNENVGIVIKNAICGIKYKDCECCLEYTNVKSDLRVYKCLLCNRNFQTNRWKLKEAIWSYMQIL